MAKSWRAALPLSMGFRVARNFTGYLVLRIFRVVR